MPYHDIIIKNIGGDSMLKKVFLVFVALISINVNALEDIDNSDLNKQEEIIDVTPQEITDPFAQNAVSEDETPEATQNPTEENKTQPAQSQEVSDTSQATSKAEVEKTTTAAAGVGEPPSMYDAEQIDLAGLGA